MASISLLCSEIARKHDEITLDAVIRYFTSIPYENATKIARRRFQSKQQEVEDLVENFLNGTGGGTCFPLTESLIQCLREFKIPAQPVLCDRSYGRAVHCGALAEINGKYFWLDPGYLINKPIPLDSDAVIIDNGFNDIKVVRDGAIVKVFTIEADKNERLRYWFELKATPRTEFEAAWEDSYRWEMMNYVVATRRTENCQYYLRKSTLLEKSKLGTNAIPFNKQLASQLLKVAPELLTTI